MTNRLTYPHHSYISHFLCCLLLLTLSGCSQALTYLKADKAKSSGFIEQPDQMREMREHAPFNCIWFKDKDAFDRTRDKYTKIYFAPITTDFINSKGWWDNLNSLDREEYEKDLKEIARYADNVFVTSFKEDPKKKHIVVDTPDKETIVYRIALTELIATKAHVNAAGTVLGAFVPGGGIIKSTAKGSIAIEVKVYDGETNDLIITWADREQDQSSLFSFSDFSWYSHARRSVDTWAKQLVELHNATTKDLIEDSLPFTLNPL